MSDVYLQPREQHCGNNATLRAMREEVDAKHAAARARYTDEEVYRMEKELEEARREYCERLLWWDHMFNGKHAEAEGEFAMPKVGDIPLRDGRDARLRALLLENEELRRELAVAKEVERQHDAFLRTWDLEGVSERGKQSEIFADLVEKEKLATRRYEALRVEHHVQLQRQWRNEGRRKGKAQDDYFYDEDGNLQILSWMDGPWIDRVVDKQAFIKECHKGVQARLREGA